MSLPFAFYYIIIIACDNNAEKPSWIRTVFLPH